MTDTELLDALEREIRKRGPLLLWSGDGPFPEKAPRGLSLIRAGLSEEKWDIRAALEGCLRYAPKKENVMKQSNGTLTIKLDACPDLGIAAALLAALNADLMVAVSATGERHTGQARVGGLRAEWWWTEETATK